MFAYRLEVLRVEEPGFPYAGEQLKDPATVFAFTKTIDRYDTEQFISMFVNRKNVLIGMTKQPGTTSKNIVYAREIVKTALLCSATGVIFAHNHQSGNLIASREDINLTGKLQEALKLIDVEVLDHLILNGKSFHSMKESGQIQ